MPTVVIADDSPTLRRILTSVLTKEGFDIVLAEDGVSTVQQVFRTMPDVVVLDVQMPRVSGYVAARLLKDDWQTADIPIILLTSLDAASDRYWGVQTGAERYFTKDFEAPQLVAAVHEVIDAATAALKGRRLMRADPVELSDDDVLSRVCDLLDRKLFETSVAAEVTSLAATTHGFEETVAGVLDVLKRFVEYDLAVGAAARGAHRLRRGGAGDLTGAVLRHAQRRGRCAGRGLGARRRRSPIWSCGWPTRRACSARRTSAAWRRSSRCRSRATAGT